MRTKTRSFGSSGRVGHDSSDYYSRRMYNLKSVEDKLTVNRSNCRNQIFCKSSENMDELPDNSVGLMITSPPYNVGKDYDADLTLEEYLGLLIKVFIET